MSLIIATMKQRKEVNVMLELRKRFIDHACYSSNAKFKKEGGYHTQTVAFNLVIDTASMTDEQFAKLMDVLDSAAKEAHSIMGWPDAEAES